MRLLEWTLKAIREERGDFSWMEELRFDWVSAIEETLKRLGEGESIILITDKKRRWFGDYILSKINDPSNNRPFLPIYNINSLICDIEDVVLVEDRVGLIEDMFDISFSNGYFYWYIGENGDNLSKIAYSKDSSYFWIIDSMQPGVFSLKKSDELLDIKLLQSYRLFQKSIEAFLFGEIEIG
ncbi:MAG: hypothetical protein GXO02_04860 [Epsilonproteobacteria bacterium]|nr:hypothetical protein [Campylobacterota bacterium]